MSEASGGETTGIVPKELASLVPSFDPATDNVDIWTSKVELLLATWPTTKLSELATRLILGCKGTAYQKLQLLRKEVLTNDEKGIQRLVEMLEEHGVKSHWKNDLNWQKELCIDAHRKLMKHRIHTYQDAMWFGLNC